MSLNDGFEIESDVRLGRKLFGNDFDSEGLRIWYEAEEYGYFALHESSRVKSNPPFPYRALNAADAFPIRNERFDICVALGCATGEDLATLRLDIGRIIAIEPAEAFWKDRIAGVPTEFRKPYLDGRIDLPDGAVDLVVALSVLHHVANVEAVVAELGRILRPGGALLIREPISSMGDFSEQRIGLTRFERGIPVRLMRQFMVDAGLRDIRITHRNTPGVPELASRLGLQAFNHSSLVELDRFISLLTRINDRYWRSSRRAKIAPRAASYLARKSE